MNQKTTAKVTTTGKTIEPGLPPGTRVQLKYGAKLKGRVMGYQPDCSMGLQGLFPVRLDNTIWQTCTASDVTVLESKDND
jgi:hypothetical protein